MSINIIDEDRRESDRIKNEEMLKKRAERDKKRKERESINGEFNKLYKFEDTIRLHSRKITPKEIKDKAKEMFGDKFKDGGTYGEGESKATNYSAGELRAALLTMINTKHNLGVQIEVKQADRETKLVPKTVLTKEETIKVG